MSKALEYINRQEQTLECKNCGSFYDIHLQKCPYCGTVNEFGDELEYQAKLQDINKDLWKMKDVSEEAYEEELKTKSKGALKIVIGIGILLLIAVVIFIIIKKAETTKDEEAAIAELMWENQTFPKLDDFYENGDIDSLVEFYGNFLGNEEYEDFSVYNWEHGELMVAAWEYNEMKEIIASPVQDPDDELSKKELILNYAMTLRYGQWDTKLNTTKSISKKDYGYIMEYVDGANDILHNNFGLSEEEIEDTYQSVLIDASMTIMSNERLRKAADELEWID